MGNISVSASTATKVLTQNTFCEKIAIYGKDGNYWIITKQLFPGSNRYFKWNLNATSMASINSIADASAFFTTNVKSQDVGLPFSTSWSMTSSSRYYQAQGQLKFSTDGTKLGHVYPSDRIVELFDFNPVSGTISNSRTYNTAKVNLYGFEFSYTGNTFFVTEHYQGTGEKNRILQFDYTATALLAPKILYTATAYQNYAFTGMQLGIDKNIYVLGTYFNKVVRIENADGANPTINSSGFGTATGACFPLVIAGDFACEECKSSSSNTVFQCKGDTSLISSSQTQNSSYLWSNGQTTNYILALTAGQYICNATSANCTISDTFNIIEWSPKQFDLGPDTIICGALGIELIGPANTSYKWNNGATSKDINVTSTGIYRLEIIDSNLCRSSDSIKVTFKQQEFGSIFRDTIVCESIFDITYSTGYPNSLWNNSTTGASFSTSSPGTYWVELSDSNNCILRDTFSIKIGEKPNYQIDTSELCLGEQVDFTIPAEFTVMWYDGSSSATKGISQPGEYTYIIYSKDGCSQENTLVINTSSQQGANLFIPNAFTPNNDAINSKFPSINENLFIENFSLQIFTRWGEKIFESFEVKNWDGSYKNEKCSPGTYIYLIHFKDCNGNRQKFYGTVTLLL